MSSRLVKIIHLFIFLIIFNINLFADENEHVLSNSKIVGDTIDNFSNFTQGLLSNSSPNKLTADPNEHIDLFSGILHLNYRDISVPVTKGMNMEVIRNYSSEVYDKKPFDKKLYKHKNPNLTQNGWTLHAGYIEQYWGCKGSDNQCAPVYVDAGGNKHPLLLDSEPGPNRVSKDNIKAIRNNKDHYDLIGTNGFKYYFENSQQVRKEVSRLYLTRVESADGNFYINYHYSHGDFLLTSITSSEPNKKIDIEYKKYKHIHDGYEKAHAVAPVHLYFNGKKVVDYNYAFLKSKETKKYTLALISVEHGSGHKWQYNYEFYNVLADSKYKNEQDGERAILSAVVHPNGEKTNYKFGVDHSLRYQGKLNSLRIINRNHEGNGNIESGTWGFEYFSGPIVDDNKTRLVKVTGPYSRADYLYNGYAENNLWRMGLPIEIKVYKSKSENDLIQQETYEWKNVYINKYHYKTTVKHDDDYISDKATYKAVLKKKIIVRDGRKYVSEYDDYDQFDNPKIISQESKGKTRLITREYKNIAEKNILGLETRRKINNKTVVQNRFDEDGNLVVSSSYGKENVYEYLYGNLTGSIDANGHSTYYSNYESGIPKTVIFNDGTTESKTLNDYGLLTTFTDKNNHTKSINYDSYGRIITKTPASGQSIIYNYDIYTKTTTHGNSVIKERTNAYGNLIEVKENKTKLIAKYDALGRKVFESLPIDPSSSTNHISGYRYKYDSLNRVTAHCFPDSKSNESCVNFEYYKNQVKTIYPNGEYNIKIYDAYGEPDNSELVAIKEDSRTTYINRNELGYIESVKQGDITKYYNYDQKFNLVSYQEPETGVTSYKYDKVGNLLETNRNGHKTRYKYNDNNYNVMAISYSDDSYNEYFQYDSNSNLVRAEKGNILNEYKYDENDRLVKNRLTVSLDEKVKRLTAGYNYNSFGHLESIVYPDGSTVGFNPDDNGRATKISNYVSHIGYHPNNTWSKVKFNNGTDITTSLDVNNRVSTIIAGQLEQHYEYDSNNNLSHYYFIDGTNSHYDYGISLDYDKTGRLSSGIGPWGQISYTYDANDNVVNINRLNSDFVKDSSRFAYRSGRLDKVVNINNKINQVTDYSYDQLGNINRDNSNKYLYGVDNNLLTTTGVLSASYEYDTHNNRIVQNVRDNKIISFYDSSGLVLYELDLNNDKQTKYIYLNGQRIAQDVKQGKKNNKVTYFVNDYLGSPVAILDANGKTLWREVYKPFGARMKNDNVETNNKWFVGKELDANNLSYFGARYYDANMGRFMSPDPVSLKTDIPATFNRYAYGANNPYKYVDPDGRFFFGIPPAVFVTNVVLGALVGGYLNYDENYAYSAVIGAGTGALTACATTIIGGYLSSSALLSSMSKLGLFTIDFTLDVTINTANNVATPYLISGKINVDAALFGGVTGSIVSRKINPMGLKPSKPLDVIFMDKYSTTTSTLFSTEYKKIMGSMRKDEMIHKERAIDDRKRFMI